ncbi:MAG TPA: S41 family peptidase [Solirubrobacterales bacterium]|nr:S41 family peptidase [Solirubrobacterales bacterium]
MRARGAVAFGVALVFALGVGIWLGGHPAKLPDFLRERFVTEPSGLTGEAAEVIRDSYYRSVGQTELENSSLQGMVRELRRRHHDRFSDYFSPESLASFNEQIEGHFSGVGLEVGEIKQGLLVGKVYSRSPAAEAGIAVGDKIISADGESLAGLTSAEATKLIKGPVGTQVTIGVRDAKTDKLREETLTRAEVALPNVSSQVKEVSGHKVGYVRMLSFSESAHTQLARAVAKVEGEGAEGIVLDLRGNPGGLLDEAVESASIFLPAEEIVVSTKSRTQGDSVHKTSGERLSELPLVVLIDRNTASAAEILTAALADDGDATVVGTRSYGKGVFQEERDLANGGALKLTVGEYFTPNGVNLARSKGIHPDVRVSDDPHTAADEGKQKALETLAGEVG